jgi:bifunctional UDP-N-acetylglucosamine pyrophosphorylase/glucosamine-1-phosphate N-acetyltransferase
MKALILAAGEGTRMRPLTANMPKPLLPVAGKPFLQHIIERLRDVGITELYILIGWRDRRIKGCLGNGERFGVKIEYVNQEERLGTAHAVSMVKDKMDSDFLCINGDIVLMPSHLPGLIDFYNKHQGMVMSLARVRDPTNFGVIDVKEERVKSIIEKPEKPLSNLINAGIYIYTPEIFEAISKTPKSSRGEYEITESMRMMLDKSDIYGYELTENWIEIGKPWDLLHANEVLMKDLELNIEGEVEKNTTLLGPVDIGKGTVVKNGAYIVGPVVVGENSVIGPNCLIRAHTAIGNNCKVGNAVEVKNTILMDKSNIPHQNYVGDSIIGEDCNLGAGTKVANLRLDEANIFVNLRGEVVNTGLRKLGVIMGDNVKIGINCSIDCGTLIGEASLIGPNAVVKGNVAPNSRIF